jgi:plastocyanin
MKKTAICSLLAGLSLHAAVAGDIAGTITLKGTPPPEKEFDKASDTKCCAEGTKGMTHHFVVGPKGELANVTVYLKGVSAKSTGESAPPVILDQKNCEYNPQIMAVQTGQKLIVKNSDPTMHNVHAIPVTTSGNAEYNQVMMQGTGDLTMTFSKPEMFLKIKCDVHAWMFSWVSVFDHPYFAITAKDGAFKIPNVPAGKYTLVAEHRKAGTVTQEIEVKDGEAAKADLTIELK